MRSFVYGAALAAALLLPLGCADDPPPESDTPELTPAMRRHEFTNRLEAAALMSDADNRNEALATVVRDAAAVGRTEAVKQALNAMTPGKSRNELAAGAAIKLASVNAGAGALVVAQLIDDAKLRDDVLERIAKAQTK